MRRIALFLMLAPGLFPGSASAQAGDPELAALSIGVAPFERIAPPGLSVPDLAPALAAAILARGTGRTVAPVTLASERVAEPSDERVRTLAGAHELNALVVGRVTRLGERLSLDVRLRDGRSGAVVGTYVAELPLREPVDPVLEHLAAQLVSGALSLRHVSLVAQQTEPPATTTPGRASPRRARSDMRFDKFDGSEPFSIRSDELEATDKDGRRILVFRRNVEARQGDLLLRADRLEAIYPAGSKQPSILRARGGVSVRQGDREARCQRADYVSSEARVVCQGDAVLRDGDDELRGESIVFDLAAYRVTVEGGAEVSLTPSQDRTKPGSASSVLGDLAEDGPIKIRASHLEASEDDAGGRRIRFEGSVEVAQEDLILRAREIEAIYPPGADEPAKLIATGEVSVLQGGREVRCDQAVYDRIARRVDCRGAASLRREGDRVTGEVIAFDLEAEKLVVSGGTRLTLAPRPHAETATP